MIDRYGVFTASEEDVRKLGVMSVPRCAIYTMSFRKFIKNLERLSISGRLVEDVQHLFSCNYCRGALDKKGKVLKFKFAKQGFSFYNNNK